MGGKRVIYYTDARSITPALEFILSLDKSAPQKALAYISYLEEQGEDLRRPVSDYLGAKLYELRPKHIRILYAFLDKQYALILHAFMKKGQAVPAKEKKLAQSRLEDFSQRYNRGLIEIKDEPP